MENHINIYFEEDTKPVRTTTIRTKELNRGLHRIEGKILNEINIGDLKFTKKETVDEMIEFLKQIKSTLK